MPEHRVAAVVPVWNEAASVGAVVRGLLEAGACCVFAIDAGSSDCTRDAAQSAGAILIEEARRGYGQACNRGAAAAASDHELIAFLDGDGSCDPMDLPALVAAAEGGADLVLGRRERVEAGALAGHARLGNGLVAGLLRARTGRLVHDLPPFKLVRADALAAMRVDDAGYGWTAQMVARALAHPALRMTEVATAFRGRAGGESKVSGRLGPSLGAARAMLRQGLAGSRRRGLLVLMAKAPRPAHSKTRLERTLGPEAATGFWAACLQDAGSRLRAAAAAADLDAAAMTPSAEDSVEVRRLTGLPALTQRRPGLGRALLEVSDLPAPFTIAVSADAPTLPRGLILQAVEALRSRPAVLGPGDDGGYYLVGLRGVAMAQRGAAFLDAPMGQSGVLEHTRAAIGNPILLPPWPDVDSVEELRALAAELARDPEAAPSVAAWLEGSGLPAKRRGTG
ncbi:MAG: DUF2064 domain-containing protein [Candidatus Dormibacteraeota bacterium]|nr:DUF2064 domain-containing protein [Candidatus Dormibacteraeota bacterium]